MDNLYFNRDGSTLSPDERRVVEYIRRRGSTSSRIVGGPTYTVGHYIDPNDRFKRVQRYLIRNY